MRKLNSITRFATSFILSLFFIVLASCGPSDFGSPNVDTKNTGNVALLLTDAPSDIFEEINITVVKAELLSEETSVTLFTGERTFNLLDLTDAKIFAIREGIPAGSYNKIRLTLTAIELVDYNGTDDSADDEIFYPKLPANGKLDLNPQGSFEVVAGSTLAIQIDMDASKSILIVNIGGEDEYQFRPVVFIDIISDGLNERYVKLHGDITGIGSTGYAFKLCNTDIPVQLDNISTDTSRSGCVKVSADMTTSIFDINGLPVTLADLVEGEPATVFGRLNRIRGHEDDDEDDDEKDDDDVSHKSGESDREDEEEDDDDEHDDDKEMDDLVLRAALIELGPESGFQKLNGTATSMVSDTNQFDMDVAPGQGLTTPLNLTVQIQKTTILINRKGIPVDISAINTGKLVSTRGVLNVDENTLLTSLIVVDTDSSSKLSGKVGDNPDNSCGFALLTEMGDRSVSTNNATRAFIVDSNSSKPIDVVDLPASQRADVYGREKSDGCFAAKTIIAY